MRSQFTFYKSFDDVIEDMSDKQIVEYVKAVLDVQFLRKRISEISFDDKVLSMVWKSQKHSITSSIDGYLNSQKKEGVTNPYFGAYATPSEGGFFTPSHDPYEGGRQQEEEKEEGKGKVKGKEEYTLELPDCINPIVWAEWVQHRKEKKNPLTPSTIKKQLKQLEDFNRLGMDTTEVINASIAGGYAGLFALRTGKKYEPPKSKVSTSMETYERVEERKRQMAQGIIEGEIA